MWVVARCLHTSPFDPQIAQLTLPQITWILSNYTKDKEEETEKFKFLCYFINPEAAKVVFEKKDLEDVSEASDDVFLQEIQAHTQTPITSNLLDKAASGESITPEVDLDVIERAD